MKQNEKGQFFSLDFLISVTVAVLAIGMLLHFFELSVYGEKEARLQTAIDSIALTSSNILVQDYNCKIENSFKLQGYNDLDGCISSFNFSGTNKKELLIPNGFGCFISSDGTITPPVGCETDFTGTAKDISVVSRRILLGPNNISKMDFETCVESTCSIFEERELTVKIWKE